MTTDTIRATQFTSTTIDVLTNTNNNWKLINPFKTEAVIIKKLVH